MVHKYLMYIVHRIDNLSLVNHLGVAGLNFDQNVLTGTDLQLMARCEVGTI